MGLPIQNLYNHHLYSLRLFSTSSNHHLYSLHIKFVLKIEKAHFQLKTGKVEIFSIININFLNQKHCDYSAVFDTLVHTPSAYLITMNV